MTKSKNLTFLFALVALSFLWSCKESTRTLNTKNFHGLTNFEFSNDTLNLEMDLSQGPFATISLPSPNGLHGDTYFKFSFEVENLSDAEQDYSYKIFYQNESYKYEEATNWGNYNKKSSENFYGSWLGESVSGFKTIRAIPPHKTIRIVDSLYITGNPLNESRFNTVQPQNVTVSEEAIEAKIQDIRNAKEWYKAIAEKAKASSVPIDEQLRLDAVWILKKEYKKNTEKQLTRWTRNPRVGTYNFMMVGGEKNTVDNLPSNAKNIIEDPGNPSNEKINPFYYYLNGDGDDLAKKQELDVVIAKEKLRTYAILRPSAGMYYQPSDFQNVIEVEGTACNNSEELFKTAHFQQFVNVEVKDSSLHNINLTANVTQEDITRKTFARWKESTNRNIPSYVTTPQAPCINAYYDEDLDALVIQNPGNPQRPFKKENAGVEGRFGFAYGKFRARIQFPELLSSKNVWNGITAAYWLKFHSLEEWNSRDLCNHRGYLKSGYSRDEAVFSHEDSYSEIDIEIVKTSRNWPTTSYSRKDTVKDYNPALDNNLIVSCTNWDLACKDPDDFDAGVQRFEYADKEFYPHRWSEYYKALTLKTERQHDATVGEIILYEIDWRPEEIIWRMGSNLNQMDTIGYMNASITKIPNNQMVPVMSQEFHYGHWWPKTPFPQGDIPYPSDPISGYLYEIVIE